MKTIKREQSDSEKAASAKGRRSQKKGKQYESELLKLFKSHNFKVYQGLQGKRGGKKNADISILDKYGDIWFHVEAKKGKQPNAKKALAQANRDKSPGSMPVAICCEDAKEPFGSREETVTMKLGDWLELILMVHNG